MTTATTEDELWRRLDEAQALPRGRSKIAAHEQLVAEADALGVMNLRGATRMRATSAYHMGGEPAKAFVAFSWCLAARDAGELGEAYDHGLLWNFKWMAWAMTKFPGIPLDRTRGVLDDMERRYRAAGHSLNAVHQHRALLARHLGDRAEAAEALRRWQAAPRDNLSDCHGCEPTALAEHLGWLGRHDDAVRAAAPALTGELTCVEQPQSILTSLLDPYLRTGRFEEAAQAHRRAYRILRSQPGALGDLASHVSFCASSGNPARGLEIVERHLAELPTAPTPSAEMAFAAAAASVLEQAATQQPGTTVRRDGEDVPAETLRDELAARARGLAAAFDERNGTGEQGAAVEALLGAEPVVAHLPLSGPARRVATSGAAAGEVAPVVSAQPESPAELAELADRAWADGEIGTMRRLWARFDELAPEPDGLLLAQRLEQRAFEAAGSGDLAGAEDVMRRARDLFRDGGDEIREQRVLLRTGWLLSALERNEEAETTVRAAAARLAEIGGPAERSRGHLAVARMLLAQSRHEEAMAEVADGLATAQGRGLGDLHELAARMHIDEPQDLSAALERARSAAECYRAAGASGHLRDAQRLVAALRANTGDPATGYAELQAIVLPDDPAERGAIHGELAHLAHHLDDPLVVRRHLLDAVADLTAGGAEVGAAYVKVDLAAACLRSDELADAADAAEDAMAVLDRAGDAAEVARARNLLAQVCRRLREDGQALVLYDEVAQHCADVGAFGDLAATRAAQAAILDGLDRDAESAARSTEAAEAFLLAGNALGAVHHRRLAALSCHWAGDAEQALGALAAADGQVAGLDGDEPAVVWQRALLAYDGARILAGRGLPDEALARVAPAAALFRSVEEPAAAAAAATLHGRLLRELGQDEEAAEVLRSALADLPADEQRRRAEIEGLLE